VRRPLVLNTRAQEQAPELSRLLAEAGFEPVEAPGIGIVAAWDQAELEGVRRDLRAGRFDWVVLPSQNAASGLETDLGALRVVCGAATAEALGIVPEVAIQRFSAAAALHVLRPRLAPGARVLVPRAADSRDELLDGLVHLGANVTSPVAYRTVATANAANRLRVGDIDIVTLCSPSAVRSVAAALTPNVLLVCLGATTAEEARNQGLRVDAVAQRTSMESLVEAVRATLRVSA
jgi:uroporphyrinogen III methyltransferase / synthase